MVVPQTSNMDTLPRVPDTHGDTVNERIFSDLYIRTSWVDANVALDQIKKGKARGRRSAIWMRSIFQSHLQTLGYSVQKHAGKVLFVAILVLSTFCVGLKSATIHSKVHQLWIQEGGRLEQELMYTHKSLGEMESTTHQLLIQMPKDPDASVLNSQALLTHLEVLRQAMAVTVEVFNVTWKLRDICIAPTPPEFGEDNNDKFVVNIFENIIPCSIVTPLDCFWEGSKLLGPERPIHIPKPATTVQWTSMNPKNLLEMMKKEHTNFPFGVIDEYLKRAEISSGYTEKPCLDPKDPFCPETAPNKYSGQVPDIGGELTGGCHSYSANYMHWPEELIVGGAQRNKSGHLSRSRALQTVIQLMTEHEMYEHWRGRYKDEQLYGVVWSPEKAAQVLNSWQKKFSMKVSRIMKQESVTSTYDVFAFSSATLDDILEKYSNLRPINLGLAIAATIVYAAITLTRWKDSVKGQSAVGIVGVLFISMSTAAGLGLCALLGLPFNAATFQVVPFLALGLGAGHIFTLTTAYSESRNDEQTKDILKKAGPTILCASATTIGSFLAAVLIEVPALKFFCLQSAIVISCNLATALLVFPAIISLDLRRRRSGRPDFFCCCMPPWKTKPVVQSMYKPGGGINPAELGLLTYTEKNCSPFSLSQFAYKFYAPFIVKMTVKVFSMILYCLLLGFCMFQAIKLQDGLDLYDIVPKDTNEHKFLRAQSDYFGFYSMFAVTQDDFEYQNNQRLLYEYHESFIQIPQVIKTDKGKLPDFWLSSFRDWLLNLQKSFDQDYKENRITQERWFNNASVDAILAYKLLVQTGHEDNPVDKSLIRHGRLVIDDIINPSAFYNYLSAWASNDVLSYSASQAKLIPEPRKWFHLPSEYELKIPKSLPLVYTQLPFYVHGLVNTNEVKSLISSVRAICEKYESRDLHSYPSGIPFIFWEQYMNLRTSLVLIICFANLAALFFVGILLLSCWAAILIVFNAVATLVQLVAVMSLLGIKLSAIPAVILVLSVGFSVSFTVHVSLGFVTSIGTKDRRIRLALQGALPPVIHSTLTAIVAVVMLYISPFEFIVRHFFWLLFAVMIIGVLNGLFFFPILLSLIGPAAELVPLEHSDRISTPSPPVQRHHKRNNNKNMILNNNRTSSSSSASASSSNSRNNGKQSQHHHHSSHHKNVNLNNEPSLTTITEEPQSWKSSSSSISVGVAAPPYYPTALSSTPLSHQQQQQQQQPPPPPPHQYQMSSSSHQTTPPAPMHHQYIHQMPQQHSQPQQQHQHQQHQQHQQQHHQQYQPPYQQQNTPTTNLHTELKSIVVQPEVTVETTNNGSDQNTKVTATANIKVELVTPGSAVRFSS